MYHDEMMDDFFHKHVLEGPLQFRTSIFTRIIEKGLVRKEFLPGSFGKGVLCLSVVSVNGNIYPEQLLFR